MKQKTILGEFIQYVSLNVMGMIGLSCYILADTFFIANGVGADGLTALNLALPVYSLVHGSGLMLGMGGATKYSVFRGQKSLKNASEVFSLSMYAAVILAVVFMLCGLFFSGQIAALLGANEEVYEMTRIYLKVILLFSPAFIMNDLFICFVRNDGAPQLAMAAMLLGSLSNIVMDYILVFPFQMGILGAVLATGCAPIISMGILSTHRAKGNNQFHLKRVRPRKRLLGNVAALGFPSLVTEVASGVVIMVFNFLILRITGNVGVAAYGIIANLALVAISVHTGIAQGMQPLSSRAYGERKEDDIKKILKYALMASTGVSLCIYLGILLFADPVAACFNQAQNVQLQEMAVKGLQIYFVSIPFAGWNIILSMYFTSIEKALPAQVISLLRGLFLVVPIAFALAMLAGMTGVWLSVPVTEGIVSAVAIVVFYKGKAAKK